MPGIALALAGVAGLLVYSGFRGLSPVDVLISIFTGKAIEKTLAVPNVTAGGGTSPNTPIPPAQKCIPKPGVPKAIALTVFHDVSSRFPFVFNLGISVVKKIKGTDTWSQHSFGNAVDIGVRSLKQGDAVYGWLKARQGRYKIAHLLWRIPDHYNHVHVDFYPQYGGCPPGKPLTGRGPL